MTEADALRAYQTAQVLTGSPAERLRLAYTAGIQAAAAAEAAAAAGDEPGVRQADRRLTQVLLLLMRSVDPAQDPALARSLLTLYRWALARLAERPRAGPAVYPKICSVLARLRDAFDEAARHAESP
jgi:flagellin-specific chaperone FliS